MKFYITLAIAALLNSENAMGKKLHHRHHRHHNNVESTLIQMNLDTNADLFKVVDDKI